MIYQNEPKNEYIIKKKKNLPCRIFLVGHLPTNI